MSPSGKNPFLTPEGVERVAELARLRVSARELPVLLAQMERIVGHVDRLREIPEAELPELPEPPETLLRADAPVDGGGERELSANARSIAHGHVVVPRVVGGSS